MASAWDVAGNPSSVHAEGRAARLIVEEARARVAAAAGAETRNVIFTSGGTEANSLALAPGLRGGSGLAINRLAVSAIEHVSVLAGGRFAQAAVARRGREGLCSAMALRGWALCCGAAARRKGGGPGPRTLLASLDLAPLRKLLWRPLWK